MLINWTPALVRLLRAARPRRRAGRGARRAAAQPAHAAARAAADAAAALAAAGALAADAHPPQAFVDAADVMLVAAARAAGAD